jgi:hypothetical protein
MGLDQAGKTPSYEDRQDPGDQCDDFAQEAAQKPDYGGNKHHGEDQIIRNCHRDDS